MAHRNTPTASLKKMVLALPMTEFVNAEFVKRSLKRDFSKQKKLLTQLRNNVLNLKIRESKTKDSKGHPQYVHARDVNVKTFYNRFKCNRLQRRGSGLGQKSIELLQELFAAYDLPLTGGSSAETPLSDAANQVLALLSRRK